MGPGILRIAITDRDKCLFTSIFENRVMSSKQIRTSFFSKNCRQAASRRLGKLVEYGYLDRKSVQDPNGKDTSAYLNTPKSLNVVKQNYSHRITSDLFKSDSVEHDIKLVDLRREIESKDSVTGYYTENMLQACGDLYELKRIEPFIQNNTDAVIEFVKSGKKLIAGLEFENSQKAVERYTRKLLSYYSDPRVPFIFYICTTPEIKNLVARAESTLSRDDRPRCFYARYEDILSKSSHCTFVNVKGDTIVIR